MLCQHVMDTKDSATFTDALNSSDLLSCQCTRGLKLGGLEERSSKSTNVSSVTVLTTFSTFWKCLPQCDSFSPACCNGWPTSSRILYMGAILLPISRFIYLQSLPWLLHIMSSRSSMLFIISDPAMHFSLHVCVCMCVLQCECVFLCRLELRAPDHLLSHQLFVINQISINIQCFVTYQSQSTVFTKFTTVSCCSASIPIICRKTVHHQDMPQLHYCSQKRQKLGCFPDYVLYAILNCISVCHYLPWPQLSWVDMAVTESAVAGCMLCSARSYNKT